MRRSLTAPPRTNGPALAAFVDAVERLPPAQREAFLLQAEGGLSLEEIAAVTNAGHETVKSRLRYAMAKLRTAMEAWQ